MPSRCPQYQPSTTSHTGWPNVNVCAAEKTRFTPTCRQQFTLLLRCAMAKKAETNGHSTIPFLKDRLQCPADDAGLDAFPTLTQCLFPIWKDSKCVRISGGVRIRLVGGYYLVTVSCPSEGLETTLTTPTLVGLLEALEAHVRNPATIWTPTFEEQKRARQDAKR